LIRERTGPVHGRSGVGLPVAGADALAGLAAFVAVLLGFARPVSNGPEGVLGVAKGLLEEISVSGNGVSLVRFESIEADVASRHTTRGGNGA
jgi:hypothetical protein